MTASTSRAVVFRVAGQPLQLEEFPLPELKPREALVRVDFCTLCGSDLHSMLGHRRVPTPSVLGHEIVGCVASVSTEQTPADVTGRTLAVGDRVVWSVAACCGECDRCRRGLTQKCRQLFKYGHESTDSRSPLSGGLAEFCLLVPGTAVVTLDETLSDREVCPVSCATATVAETLRGCGELDGRSVLIFGAGMLGLTAAAMSRWLGASRVIICDLAAERLARVRDFGASETILWSDLESQPTTGASLDVDFALEMSGSSDAAAAGLQHLATGGELVLVGAVSPTPAVPIEPEQIVRRLLRIRGVHNYTPQSLQQAVRFLTETHHEFPFSDLIEQTFPLSRINEAIACAVESRACRIGIDPRK
ncbi:alcohol dehydrogenase catalytic domain-containing protein [bacterium]|nr:alcohol dehydrogenase catalytic domain-containing protein [bacterium]